MGSGFALPPFPFARLFCLLAIFFLFPYFSPERTSRHCFFFNLPRNFLSGALFPGSTSSHSHVASLRPASIMLVYCACDMSISPFKLLFYSCLLSSRCFGPGRPAHFVLMLAASSSSFLNCLSRFVVLWPWHYHSLTSIFGFSTCIWTESDHMGIRL